MKLRVTAQEFISSLCRPRQGRICISFVRSLAECSCQSSEGHPAYKKSLLKWNIAHSDLVFKWVLQTSLHRTLQKVSEENSNVPCFSMQTGFKVLLRWSILPRTMTAWSQNTQKSLTETLKPNTTPYAVLLPTFFFNSSVYRRDYLPKKSCQVKLKSEDSDYTLWTRASAFISGTAGIRQESSFKIWKMNQQLVWHSEHSSGNGDRTKSANLVLPVCSPDCFFNKTICRVHACECVRAYTQR